jgi:hypothetical protein
LEMSLSSMVIMGPTGLLMYESTASPILLAMIVRALVFLNYSCRSGKWTLIACVS